MTITARIDAATLIPDHLRVPVLPPPKSGKIGLFERCNFGCSYCSRSLNEIDGEMDPALYSRILREMYDLGIRSIGLFFIGEPFLSARLPDQIAEAKNIGFDYVYVTTNGSLALPKKVEACMKAGLNSLKFSLNYADENQFAAVAKVSPRLFGRVLANIKAAREIRDAGGYDCGIYASSILYDGEQREKLQEVIDSVLPYLDEHYFLPTFSMHTAANESGLIPQPGNPGRVGALRSGACWALWSYHIDHKGRMIACCFGDGGNDDFVMGDLTKQSFMEAWNSPKFQALRAAHLAGDVRGTPCETCALGG